MVSIAANALPMPGLVTVRCGPLRRQSAQGELLFTHTPDQDLVPRAFTFSWPEVFGAVADAIRRHFDEHCLAVFTVTIPRTGEVVYLRWLSRPRITWASAVAASITGELEEVLAHE